MTVHDRLRAELTQVLHEVVDERVVVVDDDDTHGRTLPGDLREPSGVFGALPVNVGSSASGAARAARHGWSSSPVREVGVRVLSSLRARAVASSPDGPPEVEAEAQEEGDRRPPAEAEPLHGAQPKAKKTSPLWVPATMFTCLLLGILVIVGNYLQLLPGGEAQNSYLFVGLGLMISGFVLSTQYR